MIRIGLCYDRRYSQWFEPIYDLADLLKDLGIELVDEPSGTVDISIVHSTTYMERKQANPGIDPFPGPLVIWERVDQETVSNGFRHLLKLPNIVGWLKDHDIRDKTLNNAPHVYGYWHYGLVQHDPQRYPMQVPETTLTPEDFSKIICLNNLAGYRSRFGPWRAQEPRPRESRDIDVSFVGTIKYNHEILQDHRTSCGRAIAGLSNRKSVVATNRALSESEYQELLSRSKIVVSPYGYSLSSWKDWEAIYSGAILVKPDSYQQVNYLPDLFEDSSRYVICDPNFVDLDQRIGEVLSNYEHYWERALQARNALMVCRDKGRRAYDLYEQVLRWLNRAPTIDFTGFVGTLSDDRRTLIDKPIPKSGARPMANAVDEPKAVVGSSGPNLLDGSTDIAKAPWTATRIDIVQASRSPFGESAFRLIEDKSDNSHDVRRIVSHPSSGGSFALSVLAKPSERSHLHLWLGHRSLAQRAQATFDLTHGTISAAATKSPEWQPVRHGMTRLADGWWWCWMSTTVPAAPVLEILVAMGGHDGQIDYRGDGKSGLWLVSPRLEEGIISTLATP